MKKLCLLAVCLLVSTCSAAKQEIYDLGGRELDKPISKECSTNRISNNFFRRLQEKKIIVPQIAKLIARKTKPYKNISTTGDTTVSIIFALEVSGVLMQSNIIFQEDIDDFFTKARNSGGKMVQSSMYSFEPFNVEVYIAELLLGLYNVNKLNIGDLMYIIDNCPKSR